MNILSKFGTLRAWLVGMVMAMSTGAPLSVQAVATNPDPTVFGSENGAMSFVFTSPVSALKGLDFGEAFAGSSEFGFFYTGAPDAPVRMFGADDTVGAVLQQASADFSTGTVLDVDAGTAEGSFLPAALDIAFYYKVAGVTYYSLPGLNAGGEDLTAVFPLLADPNAYLVVFNAPGDPNGLAFNVLANIQPVPEPGTMGLVALGVVVLGIALRRRARSTAV